MPENHIEEILAELHDTRDSFDKATQVFTSAVNQIKWNRVNTVIQYCLIAVVVVMLGVGLLYYQDQERAACIRGNQLRADIINRDDQTALAIGVALTVVTGAPDEKFQHYIAVYNEQSNTEGFEPRDC